jgi:ABC-type multidrug transport system fused ATPase/permease subunit
MARHRRYSGDSDDTENLPKVRISGRSLREAARLGRYLLPYKATFAIAMTALILFSLLGLAFPAIAGLLVNGAINPAGPDQPWYRSVNATAMLLFGVLTLQAGFAFAQAVSFGRVAERCLADLRRDTYGHLVRLSMSFHAQRRVGELSSRIAADLALIQDTLLMTLPHCLRQIAILVGGIALIAWTSGWLTLVMLATFPALIAAAVVFGRIIRKNSRLAQDRLAESGVVVEETLQGIATVKAFANESYEENRYRQSLDAFLVAALRGAWYRGGFMAFILFGLFGAVVLVLWYGTRLVQSGDLSVGGLASFMLYTLFVAGAMGSFAEIYSQIQRTLGAAQRVLELLAEKPEVVAAPVAAIPRLRGDVAFEDVAFRYPSRKEFEVLRGVTLAARPGERVALVGPSGAGKSTLVSLLLRFYDPDRGRILLDGRDAREYDLLAMRAQMAIVPQDVLLFGGSIGENIAYGRPGASQNEVITAARQANAHEFIASFPEGYQTRVGERGVQLSGGQRQRVAIARAILRDPAVLILDEATSSLDSESEALVLQALDRLMQGRTSLVIAHRLSTVRGADRIFVLKEGAVVESGTHTELMARDAGVYRNLSLLQLEPADSPGVDE